MMHINMVKGDAYRLIALNGTKFMSFSAIAQMTDEELMEQVKQIVIEKFLKGCASAKITIENWGVPVVQISMEKY